MGVIFDDWLLFVLFILFALILTLIPSVPPSSTVTSTIFNGIEALISVTVACPWFPLLELLFPELFALLFELLFTPPKADKIFWVFNSPVSMGIFNEWYPTSWQTTPIYPVFGAVLKLDDLITLLKSFDALPICNKDLYALSNNLFPVILVSLLFKNCSLSIISAKYIKWHKIFWLTITYFLKLLLIAVKTFWVVFNKGKGILGSIFLDINSSASFNSFSIFFKWASYFLSVTEGVIGNWPE